MIKDQAREAVMIDGAFKERMEEEERRAIGVSVYEVIRSMEGRPLFLKEHLKRLETSFSLLGFEMPEPPERVEEDVLAFIEKTKLENGNLKILCDRLEEGMARVRIYEMVSVYPERKLYETGVDVTIVRRSRMMPQAKRVDVDLRREIDEIRSSKNAYEAVLVDEGGFVTEGSRSNIFFIKGDVLHTPPLEQILPGITRLKVLEYCETNGVEVQIHPISEKDLKTYDGAFLTGTSINILPVRSVDQTVYEVGEKVKGLSSEFEAYVRSSLCRAVRPRVS